LFPYHYHLLSVSYLPKNEKKNKIESTDTYFEQRTIKATESINSNSEIVNKITPEMEEIKVYNNDGKKARVDEFVLSKAEFAVMVNPNQRNYQCHERNVCEMCNRLKNCVIDKKMVFQHGWDGIYVIEDSLEDMGLINSVEKNFEKILDLYTCFTEYNRSNKNYDPLNYFN
jgi:hypothetical protein